MIGMKLTLLDRFEDLEGLPSLPDQILRVLNETRQFSSMDYNIIEVIQYDPPMALRVLRRANLPLYGYSEEIGSLQQAVGLLGPEALRNIVARVPALERFFDEERIRLELDFSGIWLHMQMMGALAGRIARLRGGLEIDVCFTAGLIHDTGKIAMIVQTPEVLSNAKQLVGKRSVPLSLASEEIAGISHLEIGARLARKWNFPKSLVKAMKTGYYSTAYEDIGELGSVVCLANFLSWQLGFPDKLESLPPPEPKAAMDLLGISRSDLNSWMPELKDFAEETLKFLEK